ncbi:hypothetical protein CTAM01_03392 [Colletotrichum tamarilloi]|uniref:Reverse transcriptase RNase H-like domain-containing protein n=1 Tax=Colletotrichum tamarilloi TaxID=1209934 RepID=A0ABQ9RJK4_9PEZI|nr:uncharacterized protein CTAM01_03392 [Colletotrichum tamarilloi]KAK1506057.1 hypothetical protein CTAM01_03392 [Colletotrichum tamarilloi]
MANMPGYAPAGSTYLHFTSPQSAPATTFDERKLSNASPSAISDEFNLVITPEWAIEVEPSVYDEIAQKLVRKLKESGDVDIEEVAFPPTRKAHVITCEADVVAIFNERKRATDALLVASDLDGNSRWTSEFQVSAFGIQRAAVKNTEKNTEKKAKEKVEKKRKADDAKVEDSPQRTSKKPQRGKKAVVPNNNPSTVEPDDNSNEVKEGRTTNPWVVGRPDQGYFILGHNEKIPSLPMAKPREACRLFAVVEAKDVGKLYRWHEAFMRWSKSRNTAPETRDDRPGTLSFTMFDSHTRKSMAMLLKQAAAYALIFRTKYVIMTDHAALMFLVFRDMEVTSGSTPADVWRKGVGEAVEVTFIRPHDDEPFEGPLAGFLAEARQKTPLDTVTD